MIVLVDTNVLIRTLRPADPSCAAAIGALSSLRNAGHLPAVVPQVLYELWAVATRPEANNGLGFSCAQTERDMDAILAAFELLDDDALTLGIWRHLVTSLEISGKVSHDARLVAAMLVHGVSHLLTLNERDFARFNKIAVLTPESVASLPPAKS